LCCASAPALSDQIMHTKVATVTNAARWEPTSSEKGAHAPQVVPGTLVVAKPVGAANLQAAHLNVSCTWKIVLV
jgi:hypothetical protein